MNDISMRKAPDAVLTLNDAHPLRGKTTVAQRLKKKLPLNQYSCYDLRLFYKPASDQVPQQTA